MHLKIITAAIWAYDINKLCTLFSSKGTPKIQLTVKFCKFYWKSNLEITFAGDKIIFLVDKNETYSNAMTKSLAKVLWTTPTGCQEKILPEKSPRKESEVGLGLG